MLGVISTSLQETFSNNMSAAVCRTSAAPINPRSAGILIDNWLAPGMQQNKTWDASVVNGNKDGERAGQPNIWSMIQSQKAGAAPPPYIHPLMRRSQSLMSQKSLEMCTENLGSETGSDPFESDDDRGWFSPSNSDEEDEIIKGKVAQYKVYGKVENARRELDSVNYHCSISRRSPPRSFPPPLSSISRRDGPCIQMRTHRRDGRLVVEAVPVASSHNYLHARRQDGRLVLSFIDATFRKSGTDVVESTKMPQQPQGLKQEEQEAKEQTEAEGSQEVNNYYDGDDDDEELEDEEEEEEEEEVEVVDRGAVVEVKVSTQPQQQKGSVKVLRSSLVINKFVGGTPLSNQNRWAEPLPTTNLPKEEYNNSHHPSPSQRRTAPTPTTAAAAAVAASSASASSEAIGHRPPPADSKLLFTSKRRNREELLHNMRRCSELRRPLFFWEPCCIATSS